MTIPRLLALTAHWRQYPPVHITLAAFVGAGKPQSNKPDQPQQSSEMAELLSLLAPE